MWGRAYSQKDALYFVMNELLKTKKLDFKGDKMNGIQIMGILQTRALDFENVIITPHTAFFSQESSEELQLRSSKQLFDVLNGIKPKFLINPDVLDHPSVNLK